MDKTFLLNNVLKSDGTNQDQRILPALVPESIRIDERSIKDILNFTYQLSKTINFYNETNTPEGDWRYFFNYFIDPATDEILYTEEEIEAILLDKSDFTPDFGLFLAFVQLFRLAQNDLNSITRRHLDFYFTEVLSLPKKAAIPDKVHLILELAKNLLQHDIPQGTQFKGGKDANGLVLTYAADNETVINTASISSLKSLYIDRGEDSDPNTTAPPPANYTIWSSDAPNSADGEGKPFPIPGSRWSAFGESQTGKTDQQRNMRQADIGFALASPMLLLEQGTRIITLTIQLEGIAGEVSTTGDISNGIGLYLSGQKGWVRPRVFTAKLTPNGLIPPPDPPPVPPVSFSQLQIVITLDPTDPAIVPFSSALPGVPFDTQWPVLKVVLGMGAYLYDDLYNTSIYSANIGVAVSGVTDLIIQNDQSQLSASKPFQPFGSLPAIGSAFYIGSAEVFQKQLSSFSMDIGWNTVPLANMGNYYLPYFDQTDTVQSNLVFTAKISMLYQDDWLLFKNGSNPPFDDYYLFNLGDARALNTIGIDGATLQSALGGLNYTRNAGLQEIGSFDISTQDGFIKLEISGPDPSLLSGFPYSAFGHQEFPNIYAGRAIQIATGAATAGSLPKAPYTPSIKSLSLNYTSSQDIDWNSGSSPDQFFHVGSFGAARLDPASPYILPQLRDETDLPLSKASSELFLGNFFIGISGLVPPQNLSILFQVADGSASTGTTITDGDIRWSYLGGNKWIPFTPSQIIFNTTDGFQTSGIITFTIGADASNDNTWMPSGSHWLRASVVKPPSGVSQLTDLRTQALEASYILPDPGNTADAERADEHLATPLAALSIKDMMVKDAAVKSIAQPYQSFDGNPSEQDSIYYTRVSERLRHKKRGLTLWDYERLILDAFPSIFKVKCLTHADESSDVAPGSVSAVVVPNLINKNSSNPLQPRTNRATLQNIDDYVSQYIPLFVNFKADNPVYEELLVDFEVGLMPGKDPGYYGNLLNEEIKIFLSPWAYEAGQDITFGGKVYKSDIIFFIENRSYVDFVNNFNLYHIFNGIDSSGIGIGEMAIGIDFIIADTIPPTLSDMTIGLDFVVGESTEVAVASGPRSILVSAPDHRVTVLTGGYACSGVDVLGIGFMSIGSDFIIA